MMLAATTLCLALIASIQQDSRTLTPAETADDGVRRVENRSLGCAFDLPADGEATVAGGTQNPQIRAIQRETNPPAWEIVVRRLELAPDPSSFGEGTARTPASVMDAFVRDADKGGLGLSALERRADLRFAGLPAARLTAELPHESGRTARFEWTFVQTGPSRFILVQFLADRDRWPAKTFDDVTASFEIKTETDLAIDSLNTVGIGKAILDRFDEALLRNAVERLGDGVYFRLRGVESGTGREVELGYSRMVAMEAPRDAVLDTAAPNEAAGPESGLLVWVQVRILPPKPDAPFQDVDLRAWLSWDREEEWWTIRTTRRVRGSDASRTDAVTGIRPRPTPKDPRRWLQVISGGRESFEREDRVIDIPDLDTYLSEAERLILPELLSIVDTEACEFSVYAWNEDRGLVSLRREQWNPRGGTGNGELRSRPAQDSRPAIQRLGPDGVLQTRASPTDGSTGGVTWSRIDGKELRDLYLRKGIPFGG